MNPKVGFIGLGIMGRPMAKNLIKAGYELTVWNRSRPGIDELVKAGAAAGESAADVARKTDVVITMLPDSPDVEQVILGANGVIEGASPGMTVIDMSTISPKVTREIASTLEERGISMLDAPVSGGDTGAAAGTLSIMVGGEREVFQRHRPLFEAMGKNIVYAGANGMGQTFKLCNQTVAALNIMSMCEGLVLAAKAGADLDTVIEAVGAGAAGSWMMTNLAPKVADRDYAPGFMVRLQQKDLRLVLELARELDLPMPGVALANQLFRVVEASGEGDLGTQALIKAYERLAGTDVGGR